MPQQALGVDVVVGVERDAHADRALPQHRVGQGIGHVQIQLQALQQGGDVFQTVGHLEKPGRRAAAQA